VELSRHAPQLLEQARQCWQRARIDGERADLPPELFDSLPDISIDYAVMEKSSRVAVIPAAFAWNDIGSWSAISTLVHPDTDGNRAQGECMFVDSANCYVQSSGRMVAAVGLDGVMIVDTPMRCWWRITITCRTSRKSLSS
jgi:mannose-1-phosphate guanylyltransferase